VLLPNLLHVLLRTCINGEKKSGPLGPRPYGQGVMDLVESAPPPLWSPCKICLLCDSDEFCCAELWGVVNVEYNEDQIASWVTVPNLVALGQTVRAYV